MRHLIPIIFSALLIGCANGKIDKLAACEGAQKAYAAYQATLAAGRTPSEDEIAAARIAAAVIQVYCGPLAKAPWARGSDVDLNGVLVVR